MRPADICRALLLTFASLTAAAQDFDTVVVTAARTEQQLIHAPAATTVISDRAIERTPGDDIGDLLRNVPGLNVAQTSARDINVTARGATTTLAHSELVLLDGRSLYLDFFGIVMWDLLPVQASEIERIEVVRGPGSAVWGANAMSGVMNVITKRPGRMTGTTAVLGTPYASIVHAAGDDRFGYKLSAGLLDQAAYARPSGTVPGSNPPQTYPEIPNEGTRQRRMNLLLDWGFEAGELSLAAGSAHTDGVMQTGIGPFDIDGGTALSYVQADWRRGGAHVGAAASWLDGNATNLLTRSSNGAPLGFNFVNDTISLEASNTSAAGARHLFTYGGNVRHHRFDLDLAPRARSKGEAGAFVQDEILLGDRFRWLIGLRYDAIDPLRDPVLTPRTSLVIPFALPRATDARHAVRVSYNEAFRTPSTVNSYLDVDILQSLGPGLAVTAGALGNDALTPERLYAWELGYTGFLGNDLRVTAGLYRNETRDSVDFFVSTRYGPDHLPVAGPMLPSALVPCFAVPPGTQENCPSGGLAGIVPSAYGYRNIGRSIDRGFELALEQDLGTWYWFANASWQDRPDVKGAAPEDVNRAPAWRVNVGAGYDRARFFWNATINYQDESYWADVLFARATTPGFAQVNASLGWRFRESRLTFKLIGQNIFDRKLQQHVFGDVLERRITGQLAYTFR